MVRRHVPLPYNDLFLEEGDKFFASGEALAFSVLLNVPDRSAGTIATRSIVFEQAIGAVSVDAMEVEEGKDPAISFGNLLQYPDEIDLGIAVVSQTAEEVFVVVSQIEVVIAVDRSKQSPKMRQTEVCRPAKLRDQWIESGVNQFLRGVEVIVGGWVNERIGKAKGHDC